MNYFKPNILFGNSNLYLFKSLINIFNIKNNFLKIEKFKDGEFKINLIKNFCQKSVFILQSLCFPIHDNIIELFLIIDALKRNFVKDIYLIIPYFCYSRQDKLFNKLTSLSIKLIVNVIDFFKLKKIITLDSHSKNFECFFTSPVSILNSTLEIVNDIIKNNIKTEIIISPDVGGIDRAKNLANYLNLELVIIDKRRPVINYIKIYCIIGSVYNKNCIIIDDIIDTSNSIIEISNFLHYNKAKKIIAYVTHAIFSNNSYKKVIISRLNELIIMDTIKNVKTNKIRILTSKYIFIEEIKKIIIHKKCNLN